MNVLKKAVSSVLVLLVAFAAWALPAPPADAAAVEAKVIYGVNFRAGPSTSASIYRMLKKGETVQVLEQVNAYWLKVVDQNGKVGYISSSSKYTTYQSGAGSGSSGSGSQSAGTLADRIIATAKSLMGKVTYQYGVRNTSKLIFDCSSFVEYVFEQNGVPLPWGTRYLQNEGKAVSYGNLQKGDLVLFATGSSGINHVGIYIGNGEFIHNIPSKNGVAINNLSTGYWKDKFVTARRVL
ncbi:MAG: hypothetical protein BAA02_10155 [Paenibacillaceae bacterium ZCTH02-B3]|nr:MAG: hypothetical protein BAA02_10155 [Paenibacillaceae bacterium ZCTH02-B3]